MAARVSGANNGATQEHEGIADESLCGVSITFPLNLDEERQTHAGAPPEPTQFDADGGSHLQPVLTILSPELLNQMSDEQLVAHVIQAFQTDPLPSDQIMKNVRECLIVLAKREEPISLEHAAILQTLLPLPFNIGREPSERVQVKASDLILLREHEPAYRIFCLQDPSALPEPIKGYFLKIRETLQLMPDQSTLKLMELSNKSYQPSAELQQYLNDAQSEGVPKEAILRAQQEMAFIVQKARERIELREKSSGRELTPEEFFSEVHNCLAEEYGWSYHPSSSLIHALVSHRLDCDTVSLIFVEVGRQLDLPIHLFVLQNPDTEEIPHGMVGYINPETNWLEFLWEGTSQGYASNDGPKMRINLQDLPRHLADMGLAGNSRILAAKNPFRSVLTSDYASDER